MKVKFLDNCRAEGQSFVIGEEADLSDGIARELIALGRAESFLLSKEEAVEFTTSDSEPAAKPAPKPQPRKAHAKPAPKED
jgi:hypothetical protein